MRYLILILFLSFSIVCQSQTTSENDSLLFQTYRSQLSIDLGGLLIERPNLTFDHRFSDQCAFVLGFETVAKTSTITVDTSFGSGDPRKRFIRNAWHRYVVSAGLRQYFGDKQPLRGFWMEGKVLVSVADRQLDSFRDQLAESIYPMQVAELQTLFGVGGSIGYRHVFKNGISLGGHLSAQFTLDRSSLTRDPRDPDQGPDEFGFGFTATPVVLALGYVW